MIDMASVYAERYKKQPQMLQAAVMGQSPDPKLDPYTALNALRLVKESQRMAMAGQAQMPTSSPSLVAENMAPVVPRGLGAMVPGAMGQAPQGMPPQGQAPAPQAAPMQAASGGLAGMYTPEEDYAAGGIVAFSGPTEANNNSLTTSDDYEMSTPAVDADPMALMQALLGEGTPEGYAAAQKIANERLNELSKFKRKEFDRKAFIKDYMEQIKKEGGPDLYAPEIARGAEDEADRARARRVGEAGAYFTAAGKILKGRTLAEGASEALPSFGTAMSEVEKADQAAKVANARYQFALKDAQRKERMGDIRGAQAAAELARKYELDANKAEFDRLRYGADIAVRNVQANRPLRGAGAGAGGASLKDFIVGPETYLAQIREEHPDWSPAKQKAEAFKLFQQGKSAGLQGAQIKADTAAAQLTAKQNAAVMNKMAVWEGSGEARKAKAAGNYDEVAAAKKESLRQDALRGVFDTDGDETPSAAPIAKPKNAGKMPAPPAGFKPD